MSIRIRYAVTLAVMLLCLVPTQTHAQVAGGVQGQQGGVAGGQQGQQGGQAGGVFVNAEGVVQTIFAPAVSGKLAQKRLEAEAAKNLPADMNVRTPLRKVSLVQLEAACEEYAQNGTNVPPEMQFLAGLQRIDYVFVYPETNDIVIAGPAEGFSFDGVGRAIGVSTGRPPIRLDDLVVALRSVERGGDLGCSIDPRQDNLAQLTRWIAQNSNATTPAIAQARYQQMAQILGMQDVRLWGIPAESHFAEILVEADYRMKLIAVGLETPPPRTVNSYLSMLRGGGNSMQRWWFAPLYEACTKTSDGLAYQFAGPRLQLASQEEVIDGAGKRSDAATTRFSTERWAKHFTDKFSDLADASPVFAELQNVVDLAIVAALLKKDRLAQRVGWDMSLYLDSERMTTGKRNVPRQVQSVANAKSANKKLIIGLVSGGVVVNAMRTASYLEMLPDRDGTLAETHKKAENPEPKKEHPWWWD